MAVLTNLYTFGSTLPFRLPFNQAYFARKSRAFPLIQPRKIWPGNRENGDRLTKGHFRIAGEQIDMAESTWYPDGVDLEWVRRLHAFHWLDDLRASGSPAARTTARALTLRWIEDHPRYRRQSWEAEVLATRLFQWLSHFEFLSSTADPELQRMLLRSATQQYRFLNRCLPALPNTAARIRVLKTLIVVGHCLPGSGKTIAFAIDELEDALATQLLPDGSHIERNLAAHMRILLDLIDIRAALLLAGAQVPDWLPTALGQSAGLLRLVLHGDGQLAYFQNPPLLSAKLITEALERADSNATPIAPSGGASGFYRLKAKRALLLVDAGTSLDAHQPSAAHASSLAFELSIGTTRLVTNCGNFDLGPEWKQLQRTTAAHSTLVWDDRNSAELLDKGALGRRPQHLIVRQQEGEGFTSLSLSHDGYSSIGGGTHYRTLRLRDDGAVLQGEDRLEGADNGTTLVRFHLHPHVQAEITMNRRSALLRLSSRERGWRFEVSGADLHIAESVVADETGQALRAQQLVLAPNYTDMSPEHRAMQWKFSQEGAT